MQDSDPPEPSLETSDLGHTCLIANLPSCTDNAIKAAERKVWPGSLSSAWRTAGAADGHRDLQFRERTNYRDTHHEFMHKYPANTRATGRKSKQNCKINKSNSHWSITCLWFPFQIMFFSSITSLGCIVSSNLPTVAYRTSPLSMSCQLMRSYMATGSPLLSNLVSSPKSLVKWICFK